MVQFALKRDFGMTSIKEGFMFEPSFLQKNGAAGTQYKHLPPEGALTPREIGSLSTVEGLTLNSFSFEEAGV